ncbi:GspE/PulE family protein [Tissierella creatinophila]|uniref:Type II secretion system protein E n=1 Tax=Tissierella creatinophila DSM 6911 TaxID=1123403 RepID=A0A1U7M9P0_TISCR|nr:ATPase, T2SS/T4P/T4SS family [Tissierella creatinophila]OLS03918.1 type II secretion system protein E [Tissierella creatinophila DSM 6911]
MLKRNLKFGELLLNSGKIKKEELEMALIEQKNTNKKLGEIFVEKGILTNTDIINILSTQLGFRKVDVRKYPINIKAVHMIPGSMARKYKLIPIDKIEGKLIVAMSDPLNFYARDDIKLFTKMDLEIVISLEDETMSIIDKYFSNESSKKILEEFEEYEAVDERLEEELLEEAEVASAPIVRLLNSIIEQAVRNKASDIHIEPFSDYVRVRIRVDGDLTEIMTLSKNNLSPIITRIKIIGKMNIAEKRIPQDGRIDINIFDRDIDMRISILPTVYGEKTVIRLLDKSGFNYSKEALGLSENNLKNFNDILSKPYGIILVTGPTGSGKTTTLYSILKEFNKIDKNIITVEDPVEYKLDGVNQVQVNTKTGMNFASGLRSILRQDPDIIMIGEIRDVETAEIAVRASITGHLVISTLHTNDSPSTVARLIDMGIEHYLISSSIIGIISQRLLKVLCNNCKTSYKASNEEKEILGVSSWDDLILYKPNGCNSCNGGYKGRKAIHEIMVMEDNIKRKIKQDIDIEIIRDQALKNGMNTLFKEARELVLNGDTSISEVLKIGITD